MYDLYNFVNYFKAVDKYLDKIDDKHTRIYIYIYIRYSLYQKLQITYTFNFTVINNMTVICNKKLIKVMQIGRLI